MHLMMKLLGCAFLGVFAALGNIYAKPAVIFDTDMGNDVDDALALVMLYDADAKGLIDLKAVTISKDNPYSAVFTDILNLYYGFGNLPTGVVKDGKTKDDGHFARKIAELKNADGLYVYARACLDNAQLEDAVKTMRRALAACADNEAVLIIVGFSTNFARLLESAADDISPLDGAALVAKKVDFVSVMAGNFEKPANAADKTKKEYNVYLDAPAAQRAWALCPRPVIFSGFEVGEAVKFPQDSLKNLYGGAQNPAYKAYEFFAWVADKKNGRHDRPCWDLTSVLYAVYPQSPYFRLSEAGTVTSDAEGFTAFKPQANGLHRYLILNGAALEDLRAELVRQCSYAPDSKK